MATETPRKFGRELFGLFLLFWSLLLLLSIVTFDVNDPSLNHVVSSNATVENSAGLFGAYTAGLLNDVFGIGAYIWPLLFAALGAAYVSPVYALHWWRWCGAFLLTVVLLVLGSAWDLSLGDVSGGGMVGNALHGNSSRYLSPVGSALVWLFVLLIGLQLCFDISWFALAALVRDAVRRRWQQHRAGAQAAAADERAAGETAEPKPARSLGERLAAVGQGLRELRRKTKREMGEPGFFARLRDRLGDIRPLTDDGMPAVYEDDKDAGAVAGDGGAQRDGARRSSGINRMKRLRDARTETPEAGDEAMPARPAAAAEADDVAVVLPWEMPAEQSNEPSVGVTGGGMADASSSYPAACESDAPDAAGDAVPMSGDEAVPLPPLTESVVHGHDGRESRSAAYAATGPGAEEFAAIYEEEAAEALDITAHAPTAEPATTAPGEPAAPSAGVGETMRQVAHKALAALGRKAPVPLPGLDLLSPPAPDAVRPVEDPARARALMACLRDFDIQAELVRVTPGPVVTMYEVRPAPGVRVNRIANLSGEIALSLKAIAVRIQAPIPGQDTVGIEIPNTERQTVNFRELIASEAFRKGCGPLTMVLGKDIAGRPVLADLAKMPHLLVAGATGAGKSVCLNGILLSLLYRTQPSEMQLLLVDPKRIEMAVYADEPHLVHPVVKEMSDAKNALDWAVHEMDSRYDAMARLGVRNITGYNQKLASYGDALPEDLRDLEPMSYLVIVIDELADLMLTAGREVETSIVRLAQLARASGIHMILATQRPSVNVVTGLIKANFPCRISFQVASVHDSRTILDQAGAEHLLGRGDMLFKPSGGQLQRLHGPFVSDDEVHNVVQYWKRHLSPSYKVDFASWGQEASGPGAGRNGGGGSAANDPVYPAVQAFVTEQGKASISLVQRRFNIGFNRAARIMEQLEQDGIIGPASGSKPRAVVK
ncbi:DNA translocase FtsK [uncultured Desulfovibrio sp.]|uniref:DNA translocase FtsK n=1 Tax=uncultured Desulfovibrio sp. TaxID=167968 RepID=UPI002608D57E|nr:DNA translocase FtsK [uncultured Desulfovibrio sp.]